MSHLTLKSTRDQYSIKDNSTIVLLNNYDSVEFSNDYFNQYVSSLPVKEAIHTINECIKAKVNCRMDAFGFTRDEAWAMSQAKRFIETISSRAKTGKKDRKASISWYGMDYATHIVSFSVANLKATYKPLTEAQLKTRADRARDAKLLEQAKQAEAVETEAVETEAVEAVETEAVETEAVETEAVEAVETEAVETEAVETEAVETEAVETEAVEAVETEEEISVDDLMELILNHSQYNEIINRLKSVQAA